MAESPFPLNISEKQDSWDKVQLLQHLDPSLYLSADEINRLIKAVNYIHSHMGGAAYPSWLNYNSISDMISAQANQNTDSILFVIDAFADPNLEFAQGVLRYAFYRWKGQMNNNLIDYTLISAPFALPGELSGLPEVLATNNNAGGRTIKGLGKGTQTGDAVTFEQININENINPLAIYNIAAGN